MKTLYESILSSTKSGKDVFKPKRIGSWLNNEHWEVDSDMKNWFENCDKEDFCTICKNCINKLKKSTSNKYGLDGQVVIKFNDGNFVILMSIHPQTRSIEFNFYFADTVSNKSYEIKELVDKQLLEISKSIDADKYNWIPREMYSTKGGGAIRILIYIRHNIDAIIKQ